MLFSYLKHTNLSYWYNLVSFLFTWYLWRRRDEIASILFLNYEYSENSSVCMYVIALYNQRISKILPFAPMFLEKHVLWVHNYSYI